MPVKNKTLLETKWIRCKCTPLSFSFLLLSERQLSAYRVSSAYTRVGEIFRLEGVTRFYRSFFHDDTARPSVRSSGCSFAGRKIGQPRRRPVSKNRGRFFFAPRAAPPYCFYEVIRAAAGFDEIGTKPVTPKSMAPPWIDPPHGSIRQLTAACPCILHARAPVYAYASIGWTNRTARMQRGRRALCAITEGEINRDPDQTPPKL